MSAPALPRPAGARSIDELLADARARIVRVTPHEAAARYRLDRFATGRGIMDEEGTGAQHSLH